MDDPRITADPGGRYSDEQEGRIAEINLVREKIRDLEGELDELVASYKYDFDCEPEDE